MQAEAYAPGRLELLGNHTDYNEGVVLAAAIDRGLTVKGELRNDGFIAISSTLMGRVELPSAELRPQKEQPWANYALGVADELNSLGIPIGGFSEQVGGNLPPGCGLSSSAAFEIATAIFLLKLCDCEIPPLEIAKLCQRAEHRICRRSIRIA
jgi:galactokinase